MADNLIQVNAATSKIKVRGSTGKIILAQPTTPCCCTPPATCGDCDSHGVPSTVKVVLAGWSAAATCVNCGAGNSIKINTFNINGTYCLPWCADCLWGDSFDGLVSIDAWTGNNTCTGAAAETKARLQMIVGRNPFGNPTTWYWQIKPMLVATGCADSSVGVCASPGAGTCGDVGTNVCAQCFARSAVQADCTVAIALGTAMTAPASVTIGTVNITPNGC